MAQDNIGPMPAPGGFAASKRKYVPRRAIDNIHQMDDWIKHCTSQHPFCRSWQSVSNLHQKRPPRIVEILPQSLRLRCDSDIEIIKDFQYLTLSHIWGKDSSQQLCLSEARLKQFRSRIPEVELPEMFKEAIRITRALGFKYLWIDSLCIIQDSALDWEAQASQMSSVYANGTCDIAFLFPPEHGPRPHRADPRKTSPCVVRGRQYGRSDLCIMSSSSFEKLQIRNWPWSLWAWTFQEHILSPQTILCGDDSILWECREVFADELFGTRIPGLENFGRAGKSHLWSSQYTKYGNLGWVWDKPHYLNGWQDLVKDYWARNLTVPSDRSMALAGVAEAFGSIHGLNYLAGAWAESLSHCFLWYASPIAMIHGAVSSEVNASERVELRSVVASSVPS